MCSLPFGCKELALSHVTLSAPGQHHVTMYKLALGLLDSLAEKGDSLNTMVVKRMP